MTHNDYREQYLLMHVSYSKRTIKAYCSDLRQMKTNHVEWSVESFQTYFDVLIQQYKPATAMRRYQALTAADETDGDLKKSISISGKVDNKKQVYIVWRIA